MVINPNIKKVKLVMTDGDPLISNWTELMTQPEKDAIEDDSIIGKWLTIKFQWLNKTIHLTNLYAPALASKTGQLSNPSHIAQEHFFNSLGNHLHRNEHNLVVGDFNNLPDYHVDKIWIQEPRNNPGQY